MVAELRNADYFGRLLDDLYGGLERRVPTDYGWHQSDRWTRARTPRDWKKHLECWIDLGGQITLALPSFHHQARLIFALRYHADNDSVSQSRMQAATRDAIEYLLTHQLPEGARILNISGALIEGVYDAKWVEVTIGFTLYLPR